MKAVIGFIAVFVFLFCFLFIKTTYAALSLNIASVSATTISSGNQEVDVNLDILNLPSGDSYFRVALQKEGGSYFGYMKNNGGDWTAIQPLSGDCTSYYKVNDTLTTSLSLKFKVGDDVTVDNGNYSLKAHRFTSTCKTYTESANNLGFIISLPTPTPTPVPSPSPTPTPTPTPSPTPTPTPTTAPTKAPTPTPKPLSTPIPESSSTTDVLGETTQDGGYSLPTETNTPGDNSLIEKASKNTGNNWFQKAFIGIGGILLIACAILLFRFYIKNKNNETPENSNDTYH